MFILESMVKQHILTTNFGDYQLYFRVMIFVTQMCSLIHRFLNKQDLTTRNLLLS